MHRSRINGIQIDCFYNGIRTGAALLDRLGRPSP